MDLYMCLPSWLKLFTEAAVTLERAPRADLQVRDFGRQNYQNVYLCIPFFTHISLVFGASNLVEALLFFTTLDPTP